MHAAARAQRDDPQARAFVLGGQGNVLDGHYEMCPLVLRHFRSNEINALPGT
jgi:hypothetical protein